VVVGDLIGEGSAQEQSVVGETPNRSGCSLDGDERPRLRCRGLQRPGRG
jgi:hypothetical protein